MKGVLPTMDNTQENTNPQQEEEITEEETAEQTETAEEAAEEEAEETDSPEKKRIEELENQLSDEKDKYLRVVAEYDNFRRRSVNDRLNAVADAQSKVITEILSVIDNFERAMDAECSDENYKKGIEMIFSQYNAILTKLGVTEIEALGCAFDPNIHHAVNQVEDENFAENTVCNVFQKGYRLGDKVIRCAMVTVANP
jgi:molecular chaperone GrpE